MAEPRPFVIVAGGTGGHILPGLRVGQELQRRDDTIPVQYICGQRPIEKMIYQSHGVSPWYLRSSLNPRRLGPPRMALNLLSDFAAVLGRFLHERPRAVLAMGGRVCFPVLAACVILRIPFFLHESNAIPGRVVRIFARFAKRVFLGLGGLKGKNVCVVGTPTAPVPDEAESRRVVLCVGGSQGAQRLNEVFAGAVAQMTCDLKFLLITGPQKDVTAPVRLEVREYEPEMASLYQKCCLAVTRAGAGTLAELAAHRVPAILVPYPHAKDDHQRANAQIYEEAGAAVVLEENMLNVKVLAAEMDRLLSSEEERASMSAALAKLDHPDAAARIADELFNAATAPGIAPVKALREGRP